MEITIEKYASYIAMIELKNRIKKLKNHIKYMFYGNPNRLQHIVLVSVRGHPAKNLCDKYKNINTPYSLFLSVRDSETSTIVANTARDKASTSPPSFRTF